MGKELFDGQKNKKSNKRSVSEKSSQVSFKHSENLVKLERTLNPQNAIFLDKKWLNTPHAAQYLGLSIKALRNKTSNGQVPHYKFGSLNRYLKQDLDDLMVLRKRF